MLEYRAHLGEEVRPERVGFTDTYGTWSMRMRDPARTVLDGNDLWQLDLDATEMPVKTDGVTWLEARADSRQ